MTASRGSWLALPSLSRLFSAAQALLAHVEHRRDHLTTSVGQDEVVGTPVDPKIHERAALVLDGHDALDGGLTLR
jgi:hypothetical protein